MLIGFFRMIDSSCSLISSSDPGIYGSNIPSESVWHVAACPPRVADDEPVCGPISTHESSPTN